MAEHKKIIFVCTDNTCSSNIAEAVFDSVIGDRDIEVLSRGLVVLFPEPVNPKAVTVLKGKNLKMRKEESEPLEPEDMEGNPLVLTMLSAQKEQIEQMYPGKGTVYTLREFVGQTGDVNNPHGGSLTDYGVFFEHVDLLTKMAAEIIFREERQ